ncbi:MAG: hypothetical protein KGQ59_10250 [Bdellovibrionales bacterium]|nr:hypothetical protein [Bdellovibrionales bacterium]
MANRLEEKITGYALALQRHAHRFWYPPVVGLLAALDNIILVIPNDAILISSAILTPRRWIVLALSVAIGSTIGAIGLAALVEFQGLPWILNLYPGIETTQSWLWADQFFTKYGLLFVFGVAVTPLLQQPAVILASLANTPLLEMAAAIFVGRLIKFLIMAYIGSHTPKLLNRIWGGEKSALKKLLGP